MKTWKDFGVTDERMPELQKLIDKRFGHGYFSLDAGIFPTDTEDPRYEFNIQFNNFSSVSGWATIGGCRWDEKKQRYIISFKGRGLGRTGRYS